ncbi:MAG: dTMP kinase [Bacillota bacterium]|nr:dTMP kinase [Thermoanaerobacteraceae bacterium]
MGGFFLCLEGIDGAGKTTQVRRLARRLGALSLDVVTVREPGGTGLGEAIRKIVQDPAKAIDARAEACLYAAARAELVAQVIRPALKAQKIVVADRFSASTLAYQGAGRGLPEELLAQLNALVTQGINPDLTVVIDLPVEEALARVSREDRMERLDEAFFVRVRRCYLRLAKEGGSRFAVVDGTGTPEEVEKEIFQVVLEALERCTK